MQLKPKKISKKEFITEFGKKCAQLLAKIQEDEIICGDAYVHFTERCEGEKMTKIKCKNCGKEHQEITKNCCWIRCSCGKEICGRCGYAGEQWEDCSNGNGEDQYWCCRTCPECGLDGCAWCI